MPPPCSIATYWRWYHHRAQKLSVARNPDAQKTPDMEEETQGKLVGAVLQSSQKYQIPMELISQNIQDRKHKKTTKNQPNKQTARPPPPPLRRSWQKFPDRRPLWRWIRDAYRAKLPQVATGKVATGNTTAPCKLATGKVAIFKSSRSWTFLIKSLICNCLMTW